jgi:hypothetical protein
MSIDLREWLPGHTIATAPPEESDTRTGHVPDTGVGSTGHCRTARSVIPPRRPTRSAGPSFRGRRRD